MSAGHLWNEVQAPRTTVHNLDTRKLHRTHILGAIFIEYTYTA